MINKIKNFDYKNFVHGLLGFFTYFVLSFTTYLPFEIMGINIKTVPKSIITLYSTIYDVLLIAVMLLIFNKKIKKDFNDLLINHKKYYKENMKYWLIGIGIMLISNFIIIFILNNNIAPNESTIRSAFKSNPIFLYLSAVIFAPIVEELTFRQSLRNIFGRNIIFILISGFVFGGLHVISSYNSLIDLLYIIPYSSVGIAFSYMLYKTDNIFVSMGFHFFHNGILMTLQFLSLLFLK